MWLESRHASEEMRNSEISGVTSCPKIPGHEELLSEIPLRNRALICEIIFFSLRIINGLFLN